MERLPPIPTPLPGQIQNLTYRVVPLLAFAAAAVSVVLLLRYTGGGRSAVGIAEGHRAFVASPQPATVTALLVPPHTRVQRGDPVAIVQPSDPATRLDLLQSRLELARLAATPSLADENAVQLERLRIDLVRTRSELATARVRLEFAHRDVARNEPLFRDRVVTADVIDLSRSTRDLLQAEVNEKSIAVQQVELRLQALESTSSSTTNHPGAIPADLIADLTRLHDALADHQRATTLLAPIDGVLGDFLRQPGEFVADGEPLVPVYHDRAHRVVAFLRQPFPEEPAPGRIVTIRRRTSGRPRLRATIQHVGPHYEPITNALALIRDGSLVDSGLPLFINVPDDASLRPGELVDLTIHREGE